MQPPRRHDRSGRAHWPLTILLVAVVLLLAVWAGWLRGGTGAEVRDAPPPSSIAVEGEAGDASGRTGTDDSVEAVVAARESGAWLEATLTVVRILDDDTQQPRHQRFLVRAPGGGTILVAHNLDVAERVPVEVGDQVHLLGRYEWNDKGGVIHWTHRNEKGGGGWIELGGRRYE